MGLDQYLHRRHYVKNWSHDKGEWLVGVLRNGSPLEVAHFDPAMAKEVIEEVAYWRKANQIHAWFVENVQDGTDDCRPHYCEASQLKELVSVCEQVLAASELVPGQIHTGTSYGQDGPKQLWQPGKVIADASVAEELLPSRSGFFFGGTEYDEWYLKDLEYTVATLKPLLHETYEEYGPGFDGFEYVSSW